MHAPEATVTCVSHPARPSWLWINYGYDDSPIRTCVCVCVRGVRELVDIRRGPVHEL